MKHCFLVWFALFASLTALAQRPEVVVTTGHNDQINAMALNPDATLLASGANDKLIKIWDIATGRELRTMGGNDGRVGSLHFDATGKLIGAGLDNGELKIYDTRDGSVKVSYPASSHVNGFGFCLNNQSVCFVNEDEQLVLADYGSGAAPRVINDVIAPTRLTITPNGKVAYVYDYKSNLIGIDLASGAEISRNQLFDEYNYAFTAMEIDPSGKHIAIGFKDGTILIWDLIAQKEFATLTGDLGGPITALEFGTKGEELMSIGHNKLFTVWDVAKKKEKITTEPTTFGSYAIVAHPTEKAFLISDMNKILYMRTKSGKLIQSYKAVGNKIVNMAYDQQQRLVAIASQDITIKLWDLEQNRITGVLPGFFPVAFTPNGKQLVSMGSTIKLAVWDPYTGEHLADLDTKYELIQNLSFSADGKYLAGAGFQGIIKIWDMETKTLIKELKGHVGGVSGTCFSPDGKRLVSAGMDQTVKVWDFENGTEIKSLTGHQILVSDVQYSPDGKYFASASWDKTIKLWDANTFAEVRTFEGHTNMIMSISFNADGTKLASCAGNNAVSKADNTVRVWDVQTGNEICQLTEHRDLVAKVIYQNQGNKVFSAGDDGMAKLWDVDKCEEVVTMVSVNREDYVLLTSDNYYTASRDALDGVSFRVNESLYPFDQFDLKLNRPDIVASRIGNSPPALIEAYKKAYEKRLKKMNFTEEMLGEEFHLPNVEIITDNLPITTSESTIKIKAKYWDKKFLLDRINIYVNDVPIFGVEGIDLRKERTSHFEYEVEIPLIPGTNKVQLSCLNEKGAESLRQTHVILRETTDKVGDLHIIAIGVSDYKEERFKLDFAAKDARDFIQTLEKSGHLYENVHVKEITDSLATVENILALEEYLANTKPEDVVIMFFAGHGMLSRDLEYFYGTYDIEFKNPLGRGLSYTKIEQLFNKTRALKKLLIMDTCHSGEVDTEDLEPEDDGGDGQRNVTVKTFANTREVGERTTTVGLYNSYDLMQNLFSDIRKGTGATVISSAGGAEYAYESADWSNGLFTFCFLNGLKTGKADLNNDGEIYISELRAYVNAQVSDLSDGMQNPTYRIENIALDYRVW